MKTLINLLPKILKLKSKLISKLKPPRVCDRGKFSHEVMRKNQNDTSIQNNFSYFSAVGRKKNQKYIPRTMQKCPLKYSQF